MADIYPNDSVHNEQFGESENTNGTESQDEIKNSQEPAKKPEENSSDDPSVSKGKDKKENSAEPEGKAEPEDVEKNMAEKEEGTSSSDTGKREKTSAKSSEKDSVKKGKEENVEESPIEESESVDATQEADSEEDIQEKEKDETEDKKISEEEVKEVSTKEDNVEEEKKSVKEKSDTTTNKNKTSKKEKPVTEVSEKKSDKEAATTGKEITNEAEDKEPLDEKVVKAEDGDEESAGKSEEEVTPEKESPPKEKVDYTTLSVQELLQEFEKLLAEDQLIDIKDDVETIKSTIYKHFSSANEALKKKFLKEGGLPEDFKPEESEFEKRFKELYEKFRFRKADFNRNLEEEKQENLKKKYQVIEELKELIKGKESLNKTFHEFRELQDRWRSIGLVPQASLKNLWETYHYNVEAFYDYIKINKELRDLDLKKNLESKTKLCERAEELLLEPSVVEAFRLLQELHERWREIGPVPADKKSEIWERFKAATSKINRKHQDYFVNLKKEQKKNLEAKTLLCEKAEEIASHEPEGFKEWEEKSKELIEIQKVWKTIGFAPKKHNTKIYQRFREACDSFFNKKREYYAESKEEQENNLQLKIDLCVQAESLADSTDWKKTTDDLIELQSKWKEIGPVPFKQSEKIWKRFRAACDKFFNNKSKFYANIDDTYENNLVKKQEIIKKIESFKPEGDPKEVLSKLKQLQREWAEIGYVPLKNKNEIQELYRDALNKKFDELKVDDKEKSLVKFRSRVENILTKPNAENRLRMERDKFINKMRQLESDITVWENNIGFFAESKNADSMITEVKEKIDQAKEKIEVLKDKIGIIDEFD